MAAVISAPENLMDFDSVLQYTQGKRVQLVEKIARMSEENDDPKTQKVLLTALADMDKGVVSKRRLGIEEEAQKSADEQSRNVSELLRGIKTAMFHAEGTVDREPPKLSDDIPAPSLVPGETDVGVASLNYDNFIKELPNDYEESAS